MSTGSSTLLFTLLLQYYVGARRLDTDRFLRRFGYAEKSKGHHQYDENARSKAIRKYQETFGLDITGMMNTNTYEHMKRPRCGVPDFYTSPSSFTLSGRRWKNTRLKYRIDNGPDKSLKQADVERAIANGFKYWSDVSDLSFNVSSSNKTDLVIAFHKRKHGDGKKNKFDGKGGVLAHAFYPENGRIHFDDEENWTQNTKRGINLEIVAGHEIGHALGLEHSFVDGALMYPTYQGYTPNYKLHSDDISGLRAIYGNKDSLRTKEHPPSDVDHVCDLKAFKAAVHVFGKNGSISYIFSDTQVFEMQGDVQLNRSSVPDMFPNGPSKVVAATYYLHMDRILLVKGRKVFHYSRDKKFLRTTQLPRDLPYNPDVIFAWHPRQRKSYFVLFRGRKMYSYDILSGRNTGPHKKSRYFPDLPHSLHSAFYHTDDYLYFFKGRRFWKVHKIQRTALWKNKEIDQSPICTNIGSMESKENRRSKLKGRNSLRLPSPWKRKRN